MGGSLLSGFTNTSDAILSDVITQMRFIDRLFDTY